MMYWFGSGVSGWGYALMAVGMLSLWALIIGAVVILVRQAGPGDQREAPKRLPEDILAERYARGEMEDREYTGRLAALRDRGPRQHTTV